MTPDADYTTITNCDFTNFGYEWYVGDGYYFYSIVGGGWAKNNNNKLSNIKINDNDFYENPFETVGAHEIYLTYTENSEVKINDITNNGEGGYPIKLRDGCTNITFDSNTVQGAYYCFIGDHPETSTNDIDSSNIKVTYNTFSDPYSVIDTYDGPFYSSNDHYPFIYVYKFHKTNDGGQTCTPTIYNGTGIRVTALAPKNSSTFVTAFVENGDAKIYDSTENDLKSSSVWSSAVFDSVTAVAYINNQYVFAAFKDLATDSTYVYSLQSGSSPVLRSVGEYYITAMTAFGDTLISAKKTTTTSQVYRGTYSNPLETKIDDLSSTDHVISLAGSTEYLCLIKDRKKLHYSNTDSDADKDVLYYSRWWKNK